MIKCVIFDCDGTLVDSEYLCNLALEQELKNHGINESALSLMSRFRGGKLADILAAIQNENAIELPHEFVRLYRAHVERLFVEELQPCEGVEEALKSICLSKGVASSGPRDKINTALKLTNLSGYFDDRVFSSYDVGIWKPDPGLFLHAAKAMGFKPSNCAVVEDSLIGIQAARAAGMQPIFYDPRGLHGIAGEDIINISDMAQLPGVVA